MTWLLAGRRKLLEHLHDEELSVEGANGPSLLQHHPAARLVIGVVDVHGRIAAQVREDERRL